jgi:magnesium chelatase family protein
VATEPRVLPSDQQARHLATHLLLLSLTESLHTTPIPHVTGPTRDRTACITTRPCRAPHHTISEAGLIGGHVPMPSDVSLAHNSVFFLDERTEFRRHVLEVLRQPLDDRMVTITRVSPFASSV